MCQQEIEQGGSNEYGENVLQNVGGERCIVWRLMMFELVKSKAYFQYVHKILFGSPIHCMFYDKQLQYYNLISKYSI